MRGDHWFRTLVCNVMGGAMRQPNVPSGLTMSGRRSAKWSERKNPTRDSRRLRRNIQGIEREAKIWSSTQETQRGISFDEMHRQKMPDWNRERQTTLISENQDIGAKKRWTPGRCDGSGCCCVGFGLFGILAVALSH